MQGSHSGKRVLRFNKGDLSSILTKITTWLTDCAWVLMNAGNALCMKVVMALERRYSIVWGVSLIGGHDAYPQCQFIAHSSSSRTHCHKRIIHASGLIEPPFNKYPNVVLNLTYCSCKLFDYFHSSCDQWHSGKKMWPVLVTFWIIAKWMSEDSYDVF